MALFFSKCDCCSDTLTVDVKVIDVNEHDPRFSRPSYHFRPTSRAIDEKQPIGRITVEDGDRNDRVTVELVGLGANAFHLDIDGNVFLANGTLLNVTLTHLVAVATDSGSPPRRSSVPVEILIPEESLAIAGVLAFDSTYFLVIIFGVCLGILFVVIVILAAHIAKRSDFCNLLSHLPTRTLIKTRFPSQEAPVGARGPGAHLSQPPTPGQDGELHEQHVSASETERRQVFRRTVRGHQQQ